MMGGMPQADAHLAARLNDMAERAARQADRVYSAFLDPAQQVVAHTAARQSGVRIATFGGSAQSERCVAAFDGRFWLQQDACRYDWPIAALRVDWPTQYAQVSHRDLLGAVLALGLDRGALGDIMLANDHAIIFALDDLASFIRANLNQAGRAPLCVSAVPLHLAEEQTPATQAVVASVSSLRLDALLAQAFSISRNEAANAVRAGSVKVDHIVQLKPDSQVAAGSLLSLRGAGRVRFESVAGGTRRGRIRILLSKFIG